MLIGINLNDDQIKEIKILRWVISNSIGFKIIKAGVSKIIESLKLQRI